MMVTLIDLTTDEDDHQPRNVLAKKQKSTDSQPKGSAPQARTTISLHLRTPLSTAGVDAKATSASAKKASQTSQAATSGRHSLPASATHLRQTGFSGAGINKNSPSSFIARIFGSSGQRPAQSASAKPVSPKQSLGHSKKQVYETLSSPGLHAAKTAAAPSQAQLASKKSVELHNKTEASVKTSDEADTPTKRRRVEHTVSTGLTAGVPRTTASPGLSESQHRERYEDCGSNLPSPSVEATSSTTDDLTDAPATPVQDADVGEATVVIDETGGTQAADHIRSPASKLQQSPAPRHQASHFLHEARLIAKNVSGVFGALEDIIALFIDDQEQLIHRNLKKSRVQHIEPAVHTIFSTSAAGTRCYNGMNGFRKESPFGKTPQNTANAHDNKLVLTVELAEGIGRKLRMLKRVNVGAATWHETSTVLPLYTHCTHTKLNTAAHNDKILHFFPYFGDDVDSKVYEIMEEKYYMDISQRLKMIRQYQQSNRIHAYAREFLSTIGIDEATVLFFLLSDTPQPLDLSVNARDCMQNFDILLPRWQKTLAELRKRAYSKEQLDTAAWACVAWLDLLGFGLWQIVRRTPVLNASLPAQATINDVQKLACRVCYRHDCPHHMDNAETNDAELAEKMHSDYKGKEGHGPALSSLEANDMDWPLQYNFTRRVNVDEDLSANRPDSSQGIKVNRPQSRSGYEDVMRKVKQDLISNNGTAKKARFYPCHHPGHSCSDPEAHCPCFSNDVFCEKACRCVEDCERRFRGCSCHAKGRKTCHDNDKCACFVLARECDADLCKHCGVEQLLNPANRNDTDSQRRSCRNAYAQRGIPKRTLLGKSSIHGFGVYAGEVIAKDDFVGEYSGEILLPGERHRRSEVYSIRKMSYLFVLTHDQDIDSNFVGNKMRFVNHASVKGKDGACNVVPRIVMCNMTPRILLFALRRIEIGEEFFFDYGDGYKSLIDDDDVPERPQRGRPKKAKVGGRLRQTNETTLAEPVYVQPHAASGNRKAVQADWSLKEAQEHTPYADVSDDDDDDDDDDNNNDNNNAVARKGAAPHSARRASGAQTTASGIDSEDESEDENSSNVQRSASIFKGVMLANVLADEKGDSDTDPEHDSRPRKRRRQASEDSSDFQPDDTDQELTPRRTGRARKRRRFGDEMSDDDDDNEEA